MGLFLVSPRLRAMCWVKVKVRDVVVGVRCRVTMISTCTPLFLKALPQRTGTKLPPMVPFRISFLISASDGSVPWTRR